MPSSIIIDRDDVIIILIATTGLLIAATFLVLMYYRRKFYERVSKRRSIDEDDDDGLGKDPEKGLVSEDRTSTTSQVYHSDHSERTIDSSALSKMSIPSFERTESWQSPETNTTFLPVFQSWDELDCEDEEEPWEDEDDNRRREAWDEVERRITINDDEPEQEEEEDDWPKEAWDEEEQHRITTIDHPEQDNRRKEAWDEFDRRMTIADDSGQERNGTVQLGDAIDLTIPSFSSETCGDESIEDIDMQDSVSEEEDVYDAKENHIDQEMWSPTSVAFTKVLDMAPYDGKGASGSEVPSMSFDSNETDGYREFLRMVSS